MNLTEPQAGSDLGALRTARRAGRRRHLPHLRPEDLHHLWRARPDRQHRPPRAGAPARCARRARAASRCSSCRSSSSTPTARWARERRPLRGVEHKLGIHASPTCTMVYGDEGGAVGYLIGEENRGLACMFTMMNNARLGVGLQGVGVAERAYQQALRLRAGAPAGHGAGRFGGRHEPDRRASRRPADAADHAGADAGGARDLLPDRRGDRPGGPRDDAGARARQPPSGPRC